jgi:hypothetical protein
MTIYEWTEEKIEEARQRAQMAAMVDVKTFLSALNAIEEQRTITKNITDGANGWREYAVDKDKELKATQEMLHEKIRKLSALEAAAIPVVKHFGTMDYRIKALSDLLPEDDGTR